MSLAVLQDRVTDMLSLGRDFAEVEGTIDAAHVGEEEKAALWLLAWTYRDGGRRFTREAPAIEDPEFEPVS